MLTIVDLRVGYGRREVLKGVSLEVPTACVSGIIGYNGAGKTTLLDAVYGLLAASAETLSLDGEPLKRERIAYLPSQNFFYSGITGRDYLELFRAKNQSFSIEAWSELFSLPADEPVESYSTGMKKKLALAGVLSLDRRLVLLDEPFNGLDIESVAVVQRLVRRLADAGKSLILTSHVLESLTPVCNRVALLREGRIERVYGREEFGNLAESFHEEMDKKYNTIIDSIL